MPIPSLWDGVENYTTLSLVGDWKKSKIIYNCGTRAKKKWRKIGLSSLFFPIDRPKTYYIIIFTITSHLFLKSLELVTKIHQSL